MKRVIEHLAATSAPAIARDVEAHRELLLATALLHDLGHFPFSHLVEAFVKDKHERWTVKIVRDPATEVHQVLTAADSRYPEMIAAVLERRFKPSFVVKLISSQLDVDRMDYLLRDSLHTGARYGNFDLDWLIHFLRLVEVDGDYELALDRAKGQRAAEEYILARYYMYQQVYHHKRNRAAGTMVLSVLRRAAALLRGGEEIFAPEPLQRMLIDFKNFTVADHQALDDAVLGLAFREWEASPDPILSDLCRRFNRGRIFHTLEMSLKHYLKLQDELRERARTQGFDPDYYLAIDSASDNPYTDSYFFLGTPREVSENVFLVDDRGRLVELSAVSELIAAVRNREIGISRLCFPEELEGAIAPLVQEG